MAKVGELSFDFVIDGSSIDRSFSNIENRVGQLQNKMKDVGSTGLRVDTRDTEASVGALTQKVGGLGDAFKNVVGIAAGFGIAQLGVQAIGTAFNFAKDAAIGFNDLQNGALKGFTSMLGSAEQAQNMLSQLKNFANATPFEFQGLLTASQQLLAFGIAADQVIPLMTDIGNAAAYFHAGQQGIDSMVRALGQMNASVVLHTQDLNQMIQVGVPVWSILADGMHKSVPEVQAMVQNGEVASSTFIGLFDTWAKAPERANQMVQANHTLEGSMSTIHDVIQGIIADAFKPFYDFITMIANHVADFISSDAFGHWRDMFVGAIQDVLNEFKKLPSAFKEVETFISDNGGIMGALSKLEGDVVTWVIGLGKKLLDGAPAWVQAGATLAESFANGMWDAVSGTVTAIYNDIANFIGSFFIGNSPPPNGPLAQIEAGGKTLMETYATGMQGGLTSVVQIPTQIQAALDGIDSKGMLASISTGIHDSAFSLKEMEAAAGSVGDALAAIDGAEKQIGYSMDDLKLNIDDIKRSYQDQIDPLQKQVDLLAQQVDYTQQLQDLQLQLADVNIRQEMHDDTHLKALEAQQKVAQDALNGIGGNGSVSADATQLQNLQHQLALMPNDKAHADQRAAIQKTIENLKYQQTQEGDLAKNQKANAQQNLDNINKQIDAIKSGYQARQDDIKYQRDGIALSQEKGKIESEIAQNPLQAQIADLTKQEKEKIDPLQKQLDILTQQKNMLDEQKKVWDDIKALVSGTVSDMTKAQAAVTKAAGGTGAAKKAPLDISADKEIPGIDRQSLLPSQDAILKTLEVTTNNVGAQMAGKAKDIGKKFLDGLVGFVKENWGHLLGAALGSAALGAIFGPIGALIGGFLGGRAGEELQKKFGDVDWKHVFTELQGVMGQVFAKIKELIGDGTAAWTKYGPLVKQVLLDLKNGFVSMFNGMKSGFESAWPTIKNDFLPSIAKIAGIFIDVVLPAVMKFVGWFVANVSPLFVKFASTELKLVIDGVQALAGFVTTILIPAVQAMASWFGENILPVLEKFGSFLGTIIGPALSAVGTFVSGTVIPALQQLGDAFTTYVMPVLKDFGDFLTTKALPAAHDLFDWLKENVPPILGDIAKFFKENMLPAIKEVFSWIRSTGWPDIKGVFESLGTAAGVVAGLVVTSFQHIKEGLDIVMPLIKAIIEITWNNIKAIFDIMMPIITTVIRDGWNTIHDLIKVVWDLISGVIDGALKVIKGGFDVFSGIFKGDWGLMWTGIKEVLDGVWTLIKTIIGTAFELIGTILHNGWQAMHDGTKLAWDTIKILLSTIWGDLQLGFQGAWDTLGNIVTKAWTALSDMFTKGKDALLAAIKWPFEQARDAIGGIMEALGTNLKGPWNTVARGLNGWFDGFASAINGIAEKLHISDVVKIEIKDPIPTFARGGTMAHTGMALVGEQGPELVKLAAGDHVLSNPASGKYLKEMFGAQGAPVGELGRGMGNPIGGIIDAAKGIVGSAASAVRSIIEKGADAVVSEAMKALPSIGGDGIFKDLGHGLVDTLKDGVTEAFKSIFADLDKTLPKGAPVGGGGSGVPPGYPGGNAILDQAFVTPGAYMWCEKFVGDVMQALGMRYFRAGSAADHASMQPLEGGFGPPGSIQFYDWDGAGHVAFNVDGNGLVFGTLDTRSGTGWANIGLPSRGWTTNPAWTGGVLNEPVDGQGRWSGMSYSFGERGREKINDSVITPLGTAGFNGTAGGDTTVTVVVNPPAGAVNPEAWGKAAGGAASKVIVRQLRLNGKAGY